MTVYDPFFKFIYDRQLIYHKKEILKESAPWTTDPILQKYSFCNIYRYNDRGTKYIVNSIINTELSDETKFFNIYTYRIFNKDKLFDGYIWDKPLFPQTFDFKKEEAHLESIKDRPLFSSAYTITQSVPFPEYGRPGKFIQVLLSMKHLAENIDSFVAEFKSLDKPEKQIEKIQSLPMVGPFLAGQIMLDLGYAKITPFTNNDWLVVGPGANRGLEFVFNRERNSISYNEQVHLVNKLHKIQSSYLLDDWIKIAHKDGTYPYLSLMDIQNSLCEYSKYCKISSGEGRRRYYNPGVFMPDNSSIETRSQDGNV